MPAVATRPAILLNMVRPPGRGKLCASTGSCQNPPMLAAATQSLAKPGDHVLLAGCGGGYDVFGAVPLLVSLLDVGCEVSLASLSFTYLNGLDGTKGVPGVPNLYAVPPEAATADAYCPEAWLARFCRERLGRDVPVWGFDKTGVQPLFRAYQHLVERYEIDAIVLLDGGIDALLRGDESSLGTPAEDLASLLAVRRLPLANKTMCCVGLGAELRDGICHEQVFHRIAELTRREAFLGATALVRQTRPGELYCDAIEYAFKHQAEQKRSHVHKIVRAATHGEYGADGPHIWVSPLLSLYWFFRLDDVADTHLFLNDLWQTETIWDVTAAVEAARKAVTIRDRTSIPI